MNSHLLETMKKEAESVLPKLAEGEDFYWENGRMVFTEAYHLKRGYCCGSGCRHCPFQHKFSSESGSF